MNALLVTLVLLAAPPAPEVDRLLDGIDRLGYADRRVRWDEIDRLVKRDPEVKARLRLIATGKIKMGEYQRFVAGANVAGFGSPTTCGPIAAKDIPLGHWIYGFRQTTHVFATTRIAVDPAVAPIRVTIAPVPKAARTLQDTLWEIMQAYYLDFRLKPDGTFTVIRLAF
jgi:hypothetical protein